MLTWFTKTLGDGQFAYEAKDEILKLFATQFDADGRPVNMAVFTRHELEGRLQCEIVAYFSTAAKALALQLDAQACTMPTTHDLDLLAGDPACWSVLFQGHNDLVQREKHI